MRYLLLGLCLLLPFLSLAQEEIKYKEYSYSEFFQMIEEEEDTIFRLKDALIKYDSLTDERFLGNYEAQTDEHGSWYYKNTSPSPIDSLFINIPLALNNVQFLSFPGSLNRAKATEAAGLNFISFEEKVTFIDTSIIRLSGCSFKKSTRFSRTEKFPQIVSFLDSTTVIHDPNSEFGWLWTEDGIEISNSSFNSNLSLNLDDEINEEGTPQRISISNSDIRKRLFIRIRQIESFLLRESTFSDNNDGRYCFIGLINVTEWAITDNNAESQLGLNVITGDENKIGKILNNNFYGAVATLFLSSFNNRRKNEVVLKPHWLIDWKQWNNKLVSEEGLTDYNYNQINDYAEANGLNLNNPSSFDDPMIKEFSNRPLDLDEYKKTIALNHPIVYQLERKIRISFLNFYREQMDQANANLVYVDLKNLETLHLSGIYSRDPNFENFFTWKINQFLKIFSAYGTRPAKAIVFSIYVILAFALVYLFFPNYWDSHGKNRIVDRYSFFLKYMKRDAGMQDVYLEEKKSEILAYQDYKELIESSGKEVPKFFQATALPMYKWAISGTRLTASLLSKVDVMKGTWSELPQSKRVWKSILLIGAFLIALLYDIFIKMLNALMLSINTFTTLGFGDIPIKGLPRYLAIIQGFIGWFMLTIFSVSLISQLLN